MAMLAALLAVSCGGGSSSPSSPSPNDGTAAATITITSSGVSPKAVTVTVGSRVLFVNNDSREHDMASDPHPIHTDCPPINDVGTLSPGQSRMTGNLTTARTCGYHDHENPSTTSLQGTITIQ